MAEMLAGAVGDMDAAAPGGEVIAFRVSDNVHVCPVLSVEHYADRLFSFRLARPEGFGFRSGAHVMIGLPNAEKPLFRPYAIASAAVDHDIEFFSIKMPNGALTKHLQKIAPADVVLMRKRPRGTLALDALLPGKRLYLLADGTGIAPCLSLARDPLTYERFEEVVLVQTGGYVEDLSYATRAVENLLAQRPLGARIRGRLRLYTTTTHQTFPRMGSIAELMGNGLFFAQTGLPPLNTDEDRAIISGSAAMLRDTKALLEGCGLVEGTLAAPGSLLTERAFTG